MYGMFICKIDHCNMAGFYPSGVFITRLNITVMKEVEPLFHSLANNSITNQ